MALKIQKKKKKKKHSQRVSVDRYGQLIQILLLKLQEYRFYPRALLQ